MDEFMKMFNEKVSESKDDIYMHLDIHCWGGKWGIIITSSKVGANAKETRILTINGESNMGIAFAKAQISLRELIDSKFI